ncbi:predicted response regulator receiver [gamma proteobacterium HdN1]|nr:predicted response regulator receiver [gamma proteobacterium HdN1]
MSKTVLVVDDSSTFRQVVAQSLKTAGYEVVEGANGKDALEKLNGQKISLIVSDVNMPIMDGLAFVREVKKLANYKFTPIIMLTTESGEATKTVGKELGVKAWMVKPFKADLLLSAASKLIQP